MLRQSLADINQLDELIVDPKRRDAALDYLVAPVDSKLENKYSGTEFSDLYKKVGIARHDAAKAFCKKPNGHRLVMAVQPYRFLEKINGPDQLGRDFSLDDIDGIETLARILHVSRGAIYSAGAIFKVLDDAQTGDLDMEMMGHSIVLARKVNQKGRSHTTVAANFNKHTLSSRNFANDIISKLDTYDLPPGCLAVELLESIGQLNAGQLDQLRRIVRHGVRIVIDDFGQEKSEILFGTLKKARIEVDTIKFDGKDINGFGREIQDRCLKLMCEAKSAGVKKVVWGRKFSRSYSGENCRIKKISGRNAFGNFTRHETFI